jgi:hypothetical protein
MPAQLGRDENAVPKVEKFLGVEPNVLEGVQQDSPNLANPVISQAQEPA